MSKPIPKKLRETALVTLLFIIVTAAVFYPAVFQGKLMFQEDGTGSDLLDLNITRRFLAIQSLIKYGEFPLWEPKIACGAPLFAESEAGVLYPTILFFLLSDLTLAANLTVLSAILIAMLGCYFWSRCLGIGPLASMVSSLAYGLSELFLLRTVALNIINTIAWLPVSLAAIHLWIATERRRYCFLLTAIWTGQLLAGHFQMTAICQICCWLYILGLLAVHNGSGKFSRCLKLAALASALVFSVCLSAVQLLPTRELTAQSSRNTAIPLEWLNKHSPNIKDLQYFANPFYSCSKDRRLPYYRARINKCNSFPYMGILPLLLFCCSFANAKRRKLSICLTVLALFFFIASLGPKYGIYYLLWKYIPYICNFRVTVRFAVPLVCIVSFLAAAGTQNLIDWLGEKYGKRPAQITAAAILLIICFDLGSVNYAVQGYLPPHWKTPPAIINTLKSPQRIYSPYSQFAWGSYLDNTAAAESSRYDIYWQHKSLLSPGIIPLWGLEAPDDYVFYGTGIVLESSFHMQTAISQLMKQAFIIEPQEVRTLAPGLDNWLRIQGITHIITPVPLPAGWSLADFSGVSTAPIAEIPQKQVYIYSFKNPLKKIRLVSSLQNKTPDRCLNLERFLGLKGTDILYESDLAQPEEIGQAELIGATNHRLTVDTSCAQDAYLIISNTYDKNWQASVDGRPETIRRTNLSLQSLPVPQGKHRIELRYISPAFELGMKISLAALMAFLFLVALALRRKKKRTI